MRRREFITLLGGVVATWPVGARAQQPDRMRLIGMLTGVADDPNSRARNAAFVQGLQELGWVDGRNIRIDYRWGGGDAENMRRLATELVALAPDVIFVSGGASTERLLQLTRTVPDSVRGRSRSSRLRSRCSSVAAGRQCHRLYVIRIQFEREMAGIAQTGRTECDTSSGTSGSSYNRWDRPIRRYSVGGAIGWHRG